MKILVPLFVTGWFAFVIFTPVTTMARILESRVVEWAMIAMLGALVLALIGAAWAWAFLT